jgi:DNA primase
MYSNFDDVIEDIKRANPIEDVVKDLGHKFERDAGKYRRVPHTGGLVINTAKQNFFWAEKGWNGDVVTLVEKEKGWDFRATVEWLADRAGLDRPAWAKMDDKAVKAHRLKLSIFEIAHQLFVKWLWDDEEALTYLRRRGFTDEVIRLSGMGFSGRKTDAQFNEMRGELGMYEVDLASPAAVGILGYKGDVAAWAQKYSVDVSEHDWVKWSQVSGMMGRPGIIYAHQWGGRVIYFTRRNLPGFDTFEDDEGKTKEIKSYNVPKCLAGNRQPYFNHIYRADAAECAIVEGPADAETFGMWGMAAVALCGVHAEDEGIASLKSRLKGHKKKFLLLDDDKTGRAKRERVAQAIDPLVRLVDWSDMQPIEEATPAEEEMAGAVDETLKVGESIDE